MVNQVKTKTHIGKRIDYIDPLLLLLFLMCLNTSYIQLAIFKKRDLKILRFFFQAPLIRDIAYTKKHISSLYCNKGKFKSIQFI